jgi:hypothetical protein
MHPDGNTVRSQGDGVKFDQGNSAAMVSPFLRAWAEAHHEWLWQGHSRLDLNLRAFDARYEVDWKNSTVPPCRLIAEWRDDGCPEATCWIEVKLAQMLRDDQPQDLAV